MVIMMDNDGGDRESVMDGQDETIAMKMVRRSQLVLPFFLALFGSLGTKKKGNGMGNGWVDDGYNYGA